VDLHQTRFNHDLHAISLTLFVLARTGTVGTNRVPVPYQCGRLKEIRADIPGIGFDIAGERRKALDMQEICLTWANWSREVPHKEAYGAAMQLFIGQFLRQML
jgi:hypothetical protein